MSRPKTAHYNEYFEKLIIKIDCANRSLPEPNEGFKDFPASVLRRCTSLQGRPIITPSDFSNVGCYSVFGALFRMMGVIAGHWRAQIFESWVL